MAENFKKEDKVIMIYLKNKERSRVLMSCMAVLLAFIVILLQDKCCDSAVMYNEEQNTSGDFFLDVRAGFGGKPVIPDPAKTDGKVSISLLSWKNINKICNKKKWYKKNGDLYLGTNLSFAGFNRPVFVSSYAIGDMTEERFV